MTIKEIASTMFLLDEQRTGRLKHRIHSYELTPEFSFTLRAYPLKGPEASPVFDADGNIYFASHDGCFYSISSQGQLRWMFNSGKTKNYGSPSISENYVIFTSGEGNVHCFTTQGELMWTYYLGAYFDAISNRYLRKMRKGINALATYDWHTKKFRLNKCWSSPLINKNQILITGYGIGLHCIDLISGQCEWTFDLGMPRYPLSGVAIDEDNNIYVAANRHRLYGLHANGQMKWEYTLKENYMFWGNPTVDIEHQSVYFTGGIGEDRGIVLCLGYDGQLKWKKELAGAIRGSVSISYENYVVLGTLSGQLMALNKEDGSIIFSHRLTQAKRGLWTTPSIDLDGHILITTKDSNTKGRILIFNSEGKQKSSLDIGKALSVPIVDQKGIIYVGSWNGTMMAISTKKG
ncbi:PQQ-binding-like beta-propeller repeat protein [Vallitaleaceae bacterium 9-2]